MITSSRRVRAEEQRLVKKVVITVGVVVGVIVFTLFFGLPLLARLLLFSVPATPTNSEAASQTVLPPVFDPVPEATNTAQINVSGYAQRQMAVQLLINNTEDEVIPVDAEGKFTAKGVDLREGDNTIAAYTVQDKKKSNRSAILHIQYKKSEPKLDLESPGDGERFSGEQRNITIKGTTDKGNRVTVNDRLAIMDQHGGFSIGWRLPDGETTLKIVAQDMAGNQKTIERKVHYSP